MIALSVSKITLALWLAGMDGAPVQPGSQLAGVDAIARTAEIELHPLKTKLGRLMMVDATALACTGEIRVLWGPALPTNWAVCNGQLLSVDEYRDLYREIGNRYGGDGVSTFALPRIEPLKSKRGLPEMQYAMCLCGSSCPLNLPSDAPEESIPSLGHWELGQWGLPA